MNLERGNWSERNVKELRRLLAGVRPGDIAVFDWDNTCAFNDIGEALLRRLAFGLEFRAAAAALAATLPDRVNGVARLSLAGRRVALARVRDEVFSALDRLQRRPVSGDDGRCRNDFRVFTSGLLALNRALEETPGIGCAFAYPWVNTLLQGFSPAELERVAAQVAEREEHAELRRRAVIHPGGRWRYDWLDGVRPYPEMRGLAACWQARGGEVVISTASNRRLVERAIAIAGFPCSRVIGMELALENGRFANRIPPGMAPNLGAGKVANIRRLLAMEPILVAGDSSNDYEMLTAFPATRLRLVIDHRAKGRVRELVRRARAGAAGFLAQAVDTRRGGFCAPGGGQERRRARL
jgi:phosphoserine phosphatase